MTIKKLFETSTEAGYISTGFIRDVKFDNDMGEYHLFVQLDCDIYDSKTGEYLDLNTLVDDPEDYIDLIVSEDDYEKTTGLFDSHRSISKRRVVGKFVEFHTLFEIDGNNVERTLTNLDVYSSREKYHDGNDITE